ncbi:hypothetical protein DFH06DRAFT_311994 [Mycena polygramma]|nr:hypothetical protein DFH06DRAFT_311994 [Mycena polygramma]
MKFIHHQGIMAKPSSPISTVPYELLAEIMFLALGSGLHLGYVPTPSDVLVLCQVCSFWRQAALNTPRLWTIEVLPSMKGKIPSIVTEMFLERSAPLPISVFIDPKRYRNVDLSPVIAAAHRWKTLHLTYDPEFTWSGLAGIPPNSLANLERLWFRPDGLELDTFLTASSLRDVTIHVPHMSFQIPLIPWAQLTRLQLLYDSPQPCLDIIVHCASLVSAHIVTKQWFPSDSPDVFPIGTGSLAHLEELNIEMGIRSTGEHLGPFLRRLRLPALKSLTLLILTPPDLDDYFIEWCTPDLISFLARAPNVCNLELDDCIYAEDIADVLQKTKNLTRLILSKHRSGQ